jgi:predicted ArsR family transcriptional regulator
MTDSTTLHRALADPRRAELVAALEAAVEALDASELGRRVGLHANTVRWHLGILEEAGLVRSRPEHRATPGRPRRVWERAPRREHDEAGEQRALARALVSVVAGRPEAAADAEAAGRAWGARAARSSRPTPAGQAPVAELARVLGEHGFEPRVDGLEVTMLRCPFADLARESATVVCGMHRGLVEGALDEAGSMLVVDELEVFPRPDVCVLRLRERAPASIGRASRGDRGAAPPRRG